MRIRTIRQKKTKEVKSNVREIKAQKKEKLEEQEEDFDDNSSISQDFTSDGKRAAPALNAEPSADSPLETVAATAPATQKSTATEENNKKLYSGNYNGPEDYSENKYTIIKETNMQNAFENDTERMRDVFSRRAQQSMQGQNVGARDTWQQQQAAMPEKKYEADLDTVKSSTKRRRMG